MPRYYTIASSSKVSPAKVRIAISLTHDEALKKYGQASRFLNDAQVGNSCHVFVKDSMFEMPTKPETPMIMVGPGTGIVPFIGFIEQMQNERQQYGETHLYFGCRNPDSDFIFKDTLESAKKNGTLSELNVAFSRSDPKEYVQDILRRHKDKLLALIE
jgi:cytochrome P450/NADPH-cytochrome P450 reductase